MSSKTIWIIAKVIVIVILIFVIARQFSKPSGQSQNKQASQNSGDQQQANQNQTQPSPQPAQQLTGCPNGQNVTSMDANGRFKPTIDIANKQAILDTNFGKISIQLYGSDAPKTVENFVCLIQKGYYNGLTFHRVAHGFVIQGGDPTATGSGGTSIYGGPFEDELYSNTSSYQAGYVKGTVAMANAGPNTNTSQFFIMLGDLPLPHNYTIFGKVISGQSVVDTIGALPVTPVLGPDDGTPTKKVIINTASVVSAK